MNLRTLPCEGRSRPGTSWNHSAVRGGGMAFEGACSRCVPVGRFTGTEEPSLVEEDNSTRCAACGGNGWRAVRNSLLGPGIYEVRCDDCNGFGWVEGPEDSRP